MKKIFTVIMLLCFQVLFAQPPQVIFHLNDAEPKSFDIFDIDNITLLKGPGSFNMNVYISSSPETIPTKSIDSMRFMTTTGSETILKIFLKGATEKNYDLAEIDSITFTALPGPNITGITPKSAKVGDVITIAGSNFGATQGSSSVEIGGIKAISFTSWKDKEIKAKVPVGAITGKLSVTVNDVKSNEVDLTILVDPKITNISPSTFTVGTVVTITGVGFSDDQTNNYVNFNNTPATEYNLWSDTEIQVLAPKGAPATGQVSVSVNGLKSNKVNYKIVTSAEMVLIPGGTFQMGNTGGYQQQGETPHSVTVSGFYMSKYEVMQYLYNSLMGKNPSSFKGDSSPVERASWYDACEFCNRLSDRDGFTKCYDISGTSITCDWNANGYRLPTEAEWEYACKGGTTTDFYNGNLIQPDCTPLDATINKIGWYCGNSPDVTQKVGLKTPNKYGLYDMIGNVWEWVWDWMGPYDTAPATDPKGASSSPNNYKVLRGGSWHNSPSMCRAAMRGMDVPEMMSTTDGIRLVRKQ
jgi:formylglycine-generating enzyme